VFEKINANTLPKHRPYDYTIDLVEGVQPPFKPIYNLSQNKLATLCEYFNDNIEKGFIQHSKFLIGVTIIFVINKYGFLQMCVDYRGLNQFTIKNRCPLPLISRLLD